MDIKDNDKVKSTLHGLRELLATNTADQVKMAAPMWVIAIDELLEPKGKDTACWSAMMVGSTTYRCDKDAHHPGMHRGEEGSAVATWWVDS